MSVVQADPIVDPSLTQILRQLCRALNPVKALRKHRASPPASTDGKKGSRCRRGLQNSIEILNVVFSAAGTIPVVGQPLKDALEALYKILRQVEEKFQNAEAASKLLQRLASLGRKLSAVDDPDPLLAELTEHVNVSPEVGLVVHHKTVFIVQTKVHILHC